MAESVGTSILLKLNSENLLTICFRGFRVNLNCAGKINRRILLILWLANKFRSVIFAE